MSTVSNFGLGQRKLKVYWRFLRPVRRAAKLAALRFFLRIVPRESQRVFVLTLIVGAVCGLAAVGFHLAILRVEDLLINRASQIKGAAMIWLVILLPTLGGLLSGLLLEYVFPGSRGSGIPQVKIAYEIKGGRLSIRDSIGKFIVGVLQIGSGASLGREGPTVHICSGIASALGRTFALSQQSLRRLLPVGAAAGIAAAFNAPIAAVTFTIEEVVGDLDQTVLSGVIVAAAIAAAIERSILGEHPVFTVTGHYGLNYFSSIFFYAVLGIAAAFVSLAFTESLINLRAGFRQLIIIPVWARPGIGGLVTGILAAAALYFLQTGGVTGSGYETLSTALSGQLALRVMVVLCLLKLAATVFSYGSGGAGGIFAPALFIGGMLGGTVGFLDVKILGHSDNQIGAFALVGMGAVFAGIIRAPMTSVLIIFEMTGSYGLILPLMIANMTAYGIARRFRPIPIYEALLEQDGIHLPHRDKRPPHALEKLKVGDAMTTTIVTLSANLTVAQALERTLPLPFSIFPVIDQHGRCLGVVTEARLRRNLAQEAGNVLVAELIEEAQQIYPENLLSRAIVKMNQAKTLLLTVVEQHNRDKLLGIITMSDIVRAQAHAITQMSDVEDSLIPDFDKTRNSLS